VSASEGLPGTTVSTLAADQRAKYIYAGTSNGVFRSQNEGKTWATTADVGWLGVSALAVDPKDGRTAYASSNGRFFRTRDAGRTWTVLSDVTATATFIHVDPIDSDTLYVLAWTRVLKSIDQGDTWVDVRGGLPGPAIYDLLAIDRSRSGSLYISDGRDIFRTSDAGRTWSPFPSQGINSLAHPFSLVVDGNGRVLYSSTDRGVFAYEIRPYSFYPSTPCRIMDTRSPAGPSGGPNLEAGFERVALVSGRCGIPATARSVALNITVTQPSAAGHLTAYETGIPPPDTFSISYSAGRTRANNAIVGLDPLGRFTVKCMQASGTVHFIADVTGYFE
jgi:hypothetical protein